MAPGSEAEARRVVLVTGASRGIGRACAEGFAAAGCIVAVNSTTAEGAAGEIAERYDVPALALAADAGDDKAGVIVNLASIMGERGAAGASAHAATKAAIASLTRSVARELGAFGIRVNAIAPGLIQNDMLAGLKPEQLAERVATIPLGRVGTPEEVPDLTLFLASDKARDINGQVIGLDGGMP